MIAALRFARSGVQYFMENQSFRTPIVIYAGLPSKFYLVSTVSDASDFLFDNWAPNDSLQWVDAMNRCAKAGAGEASVEGARSAFLVAVKAAGIRVDPSVPLF
ncbi:DUF982 domain-containing protein [Mesorhizobium sp. 1M-11]|uniref:DUF982 domain-containing protein n=1 Tax=Mesorhizobium sp. 1M-11 TaxID=1529006 RepID=UPI001FCD2F19|nr:DUF982 domain-containing protein [Mesorhizobium sp. 1M-11]